MKKVNLTGQCCDFCQEWAAVAPPAKGFCKALERQTWGCQWCPLFVLGAGS
jgi:hypothetical protein